MRLDGRRRRVTPARTWAVWGAAWLGLAAVATANGTVRTLGYEERMGELRAHQLSTGLLVAVLWAYVWLLHRRCPLPTTRSALGIGAGWTLLTLGFEFGLGRGVLHRPWSVLLADYDLTSGRIWVLVPIATAAAPALVRAAQTGRPA
jgi:hypothetical protein